MCCCPLGGSIPGAPNRASGEALGVGGRRRRPANAGRGVQLLTQPTGGEGFGILSSDAYSLQAAPPASCSSRCGSGLCSASVASVMKELTLLQLSPFGHVRALYTCPCTHVGTLVRCALRLSDNAVVARVPVPRGVLMLVKKDRNKCSCSNWCACGRQGGAPSSSQLPCTFNPLHWQLLDQESIHCGGVCRHRHRHIVACRTYASIPGPIPSAV